MERKRRTGTIGVWDKEPSGFLVDEAKKIQRQKKEKAIARAANRKPPTNRQCYVALFEEYDRRVAAGGSRWLPKCNRCQATLHPDEPAHVCEGFKPRYEVWSDERKERAEARRQAIREGTQLNPIVCSVCGEEMPEMEDGERHWNDHEGRPEREYQAIDGEPDGDLEGYEDEEEEDYCEGDDDGWECEDDGDPMWE